ncbi:MAG: hypothetical protein JWO06_2065 [Bacteroidota bacterium]|nr:hypothetical protein [Bacteroidota bacterium]
MIGLLLFSAGNAQVNDASGVPRGGHKGDSIEYKDDRSKHVHEEITVMPVHKNKSDEAKGAGKGIHSADTGTVAVASDTIINAADTLNAVTMAKPDTGNPEVNTGSDRTLIYTAVAVFGLAALIGMYLLTLVLKDSKRPLIVAMIHGLFASVGIILLIAYCCHSPGPIASIIIFCLAALGGVILFYTDVTGKKVPKWLAVVHGLAAITGFVLLLIFAFSQSAI